MEEKNLYFYHPNHLGSSSYITDRNGEVIQHTEYMAFGEVLVDEHSVSNKQPYLFNGKELDYETGLYYYGERYYDPKVSIFLNVDPLVEKTGTPYAYTYNNPIRFIDPTGMAPEWREEGNGVLVAEKGDSAGSLAKHLNISQQSAEQILINNGYLSYSKNGKNYTQINEGSKINVIPNKTSEFNQTLKDTYKFFLIENYKFEKMWPEDKKKEAPLIYMVQKLEVFRQLVTDHSDYDIKNNPNSPFFYDPKSKSGLGNFYKGQAIFNGEIFRFDDFGNYNYGVAARAFGLGQNISELGAGVNQLTKWRPSFFGWKPFGSGVPIGNVSTYFDDFRDNEMVKRGYNHKFRK